MHFKISAFQNLPVILFANALIAICYHFGIIQAIVAVMGGALSFCLGTTPIESTNAAANVFLGLVSMCRFLKINKASQSEQTRP